MGKKDKSEKKSKKETKDVPSSSSSSSSKLKTKSTIEQQQQQQQQQKIVLDVQENVSTDKKLIDPAIIVSFATSKIPQDLSTDLTFHVHASSENRRKRQRVIHGETDYVSYKGSNFGEMNANSLDLSEYMVGIRPKNSKKMKLYDAGHIYTLNRSVKAHRNKEIAHNAFQDVGYIDKRKLLTESFGSKKAKVAQRKMDDGRVKEANISTSDKYLSTMISKNVAEKEKEKAKGKAGSSSSSSTTAKDATQEALENMRNEILPRFNISAKHPSDAYPLDGIVSQEDLKNLRYILSSIEKKAKLAKEEKANKEEDDEEEEQEQDEDEDREEDEEDDDATDIAVLVLRHYKRWPVFVKSRLVRVIALPNMPKRKLQIQLLLYLKFLIEIYSSEPPYTVSKSSHFLKIPESIMTSILSTFARPSEGMIGRDSMMETTYSRGKTMKDKLTLYILILCLHIDGFESTTKEIAQDFKLTVPTVKNYYLQTGATYRAPRKTNPDGTKFDKSNFKDIVLKCPLTFPRPKRGR